MGTEQVSHLNYLRNKAEELAEKRRIMQAYIDKSKLERKKKQRKE